MNYVLDDLIGQGVHVYIDDILVYSKTEEEHERLTREVMRRLRAHSLRLKLSKCVFGVPEIEFLGHIISDKGIRMVRNKVDAILEFPAPKTLKILQMFLGMGNYYRNFIPGYSKIVVPLVSLLKKDVPFVWGNEQQAAFEHLKRAFTSDPVLYHPDPNRRFIIETDASDYAMGGVLLQDFEDGEHPLAYFSKKFSPAELNYDVYNKELFAVVTAFKEWRYLLDGSKFPITVNTDHKNLEYWQKAREMNRRQIRWSSELGQYDYVIRYIPGSTNRADALSRNPDMVDNTPVTPNVMLKPALFVNNVTVVNEEKEIDHLPPLLLAIRDAQQQDEWISKNKRDLTVREGLYCYEDRIVVPTIELQTKILKLSHDSELVGHMGITKTQELISRDFWWPKFRQVVTDYVNSCDICQRAKPTRHAPHGLLQPLKSPAAAWTHLTMDFIVALPESCGFDAILTIVDRFSKMAHFVPCRTTATAEDLYDLIKWNVIRLHGVPEDIVTDRGTQFNAHFWRDLSKRLNIHQSMTTAYHPEGDGQSERLNQSIETYLRCFINHVQDDWFNWIPSAEFAYNNGMHSATGKSPFNVVYRGQPNWLLPSTQRGNIDKVNKLADDTARVWSEVIASLLKSQESMKRSADKNRIDHEFRVGDLVTLSMKNVASTRPSAKLDFKRVGPFRLMERIGPNTFRLQLPENMKIHDTFNVKLLEPYHAREGQDVLNPDGVGGRAEHEIVSIVSSKLRWKKFCYEVLWRDQPRGPTTWEPVSVLEGYPHLVDEFHAKYPSALKPEKFAEIVARLDTPEVADAALPASALVSPTVPVAATRDKPVEQSATTKDASVPAVGNAPKVVVVGKKASKAKVAKTARAAKAPTTVDKPKQTPNVRFVPDAKESSAPAVVATPKRSDEVKKAVDNNRKEGVQSVSKFGRVRSLKSEFVEMPKPKTKINKTLINTNK